MTMMELEKKAYEIKALERMKEQLEAEISAKAEEIKAEMTEMGTDSLVAGAFKISWKLITSSRLDTAALKKALPDVAARFMMSNTCRRFVIN